MKTLQIRRASSMLAALLLAPLLSLGLASAARAQSDTVLFSTFVQPNVLLVLDNSESMQEIVWHPDFDPAAAYACTYYAPDDLVYFGNDTNLTRCSKARTIYTDTGVTDTIYRGSYLNWLFSDVSDAAYLEIGQGSNGTPSSCTGGSNFAKYQRARISAAKRAIQEVICEVNETVGVRFGMMVYRSPGTDDDPNGGFVIEEVEDYDSAQAADLVSAMQSIRADTYTPVGEALFQAYTYFMSRSASDRPVGRDGSTVFPEYRYSTSSAQEGGAYLSNAGLAPDSPVQYACQKNFIIVVTDGQPTFDDFDASAPSNTALGFSDFGNLIGDYYNEGEVEEQTSLICTDCETALYLDDIAHFMQSNDFRPDMDGDQTIDTYTIGFATDAFSAGLLSRTAQLGNGIFFATNDADQMAQAIVDAFADIIEKAQSFTAATVPATRTSVGEHLYVSLFVPSEKTPYWEGHLRSFSITGAGEIYDKNGVCALDDPNAGQCFSGPFKSTAVPFWDAHDEVPAAGSRNLSVSRLNAGVPEKVAFDTALSASDLGVVFPSVEVYPNSTANNANGLKDEIVMNVRGCNLGTGVLTADVNTPTACVPRANLQGDVFHASPVVVAGPSLYQNEPSFAQFAANHATRDRLIMAGSNAGFFHGWDAGSWDVAATPAPSYTPGSGAELFGFMPWPARQTIRHKPIDTGSRDYYYVDGSPSVADLWMYTNPTTAAKLANGSEWRTVVASGMRQGGEAYFALDITDPSAASYPDYLWEFPAENAAAGLKQYFGQTWGEPVFTRIKVKVGADDNAGAGYERWVMIVTGGYDDSGDPNNVATYNATATKGRGIFIVDVKTGTLIAAKVYSAVGSAAEQRMLYAIPSSPAVYDIDHDGDADMIVVGDLGGQVWKWVINNIGEDRVNDGSGSLSQPNWPFRQLFTAPILTTNQTSSYHYKSFFYPPAATFQGGTMWLAFGSGERANPNFMGLPDGQGDPINSNVDNNRFYALKDGDPLETQAVPQSTATESDLADLSNTAACSDVTSYRGYYFLGAEGEKFVTNIDIFLGHVFVGAFTPTIPTDPCELGGASSLYVFRIHCGEGFFQDAASNPDRTISLGGGLPTDPRITVGSDGDSSNRVIINMQGGGIINFEAPPGFSGYGMWYWREVTQ